MILLSFPDVIQKEINHEFDVCSICSFTCRGNSAPGQILLHFNGISSIFISHPVIALSRENCYRMIILIQRLISISEFSPDRTYTIDELSNAVVLWSIYSTTHEQRLLEYYLMLDPEVELDQVIYKDYSNTEKLCKTMSDRKPLHSIGAAPNVPVETLHLLKDKGAFIFDYDKVYREIVQETPMFDTAVLAEYDFTHDTSATTTGPSSKDNATMTFTCDYPYAGLEDLIVELPIDRIVYIYMTSMSPLPFTKGSQDDICGLVTNLTATYSKTKGVISFYGKLLARGNKSIELIAAMFDEMKFHTFMPFGYIILGDGIEQPRLYLKSFNLIEKD